MLPGRQLSLDALRQALRRWRWLVIAPALVGALGGLLYSRWAPSLYRSTTLIQIVPQRVPESYVNATVTERIEDRLRAITQQVLSRTQLEKLITDLDLFRAERQVQPMEDVVLRMTSRVSIEPVAGARARFDAEAEAFQVTFDYEDGATAQKVVERLASFFIDTNARERGSQAEQTSAFLEAQMADARTRLEAQERKLKDFRERNAGRLPTQMTASMQAIQSAQMALQSAVESLARDRDRKLILERLYKDATDEAEASGTTTAGGTASGDPTSGVPANAPAEQRLEAARRALAQMEMRLSAKHPDVARVKRLIEDLEQQVEAESLQRPVSPESADEPRGATPEETRRRDKLRVLRAEIESLDRQIAFKASEERRLRAEIAGYQRRLEAVPGVESEWVALTRDYDTLQMSYRELLGKSENSKMAASLEQRQIGEQFRILDPPRVPQNPFSPNRPRINMLGTAAGIGVGVVLLGLAWVSDSTMRSEADLVGAIDLPVLALLPYVANEQDRRVRRRRRWLEGVVVVALVVAIGALFWFLRLWRFLA